MAKRFQETVGIGQLQTGTGAPQAIASLVDRLESFKQGFGRVAEQEAIRRGVESAAQTELVSVDGVTQAPEEKKAPLMIGSIEVNAHNKALRAAYLSSIDNDNRTNIARISLENSDNLVGFNEAINGYKKGVLQSTEPSLRQTMAIDLDQKINATRLRIQENTVKKQEAEAKSEIFSNTESAAREAARDSRNGDIESSAINLQKSLAGIDAALAAGYIDKAESEKTKRNIEREVTEQGFMNEVDTLAETSIQGAFDKIDELGKRVPSGFTPDEWDSFLVSAQQDVNRKQARANKELKATQKEIERQESLARGDMFTNPEIPADPAKASQDRKDVNAFYDQESKKWAGLPLDQQLDNNLEFIQNTGIMPDSMISSINAVTRSGTPEQVLVFTDLMARIAREPNSANIMRDLPADARAIGLQFADSVASGIDSIVAMEIARKNTFGLSDQERERIKLETQAVRQDIPSFLEDMADRDFDPSFLPFFGEEPDITSGMLADFRVAFGEFMVLTNGSADQSKVLAWDALKKNWDVTETGGDKRFMKYAPEAFYSVGGVSNDWIPEQFDADILSLGHNPEDVSIAVDFDTARSGQPSYPVVMVDEEGRTIPIFDNDGNVLRWQPNFEATGMREEAGKVQTQNVRKAKELQRKSKRLSELLGIAEEGVI